MSKKRMITGVKPTNSVTIGNYLGVIKSLVKYQDEYDLYVFIADLHALTLPIDSEELRQNIEKAQLINYLKATNYRLGLLINFGEKSLVYKRFSL